MAAGSAWEQQLARDGAVAAHSTLTGWLCPGGALGTGQMRDKRGVDHISDQISRSSGMKATGPGSELRLPK